MFCLGADEAPVARVSWSQGCVWGQGCPGQMVGGQPSDCVASLWEKLVVKELAAVLQRAWRVHVCVKGEERAQESTEGPREG